MSMPSVGAMGTEQCSVLGQKTVGIWDPVGSQKSEDMVLMSKDTTGDYRHYTALHGTDANESQEYFD